MAWNIECEWNRDLDGHNVTEMTRPSISSARSAAGSVTTIDILRRPGEALRYLWDRKPIGSQHASEDRDAYLTGVPIKVSATLIDKNRARFGWLLLTRNGTPAAVWVERSRHPNLVDVSAMKILTVRRPARSELFRVKANVMDVVELADDTAGMVLAVPSVDVELIRLAFEEQAA